LIHKTLYVKALYVGGRTVFAGVFFFVLLSVILISGGQPAAAQLGETSRDDNKQDNEDDRAPFQERMFLKQKREFFFFGDHLCRCKGEDACSDINNRRKTLDPFNKQGTAPDNNGNADQQTQNDKQVTAMCCTCHGQDIVQSHRRIGQDDRTDRRSD